MQNKKPITNRMVFVIDGFTKGGAQKNLQLIIPELVTKGCSVDLILLQNSPTELDMNALASVGVTIRRVSASNMLDLFGFIKFLLAIGSGPGVIVANLYWSQIWSSILTIFNRKLKVAWVEHNTYFNRSKMQWAIFQLLSTRAKVLLSVSTEIQEFVAPRVYCHLELINNAAIAYFDRKRASIENPQFLLVGRLIPQKNPALALHAFKLAISNESIPFDSKLLIIGTGPLTTHLIEESKRLEIHSSVEFLGFLDSYEISRIMAESQVLLMTSLHEGSPLVRLEALAHGMAIVTTKTAGIRGILTMQRSDNLLPGVVVSDANAGSFAKSLGVALEESSWSPEAINTRLEAARNFHPSKVASAYFKLLTS